MPVDNETKLLFAFCYEGQSLTWTRLPQGFADSPVVYSIVLQATLQPWHPPHGSVLLQYVDDLLLCSPSVGANLEDGLSLLQWLHVCGHNVSLKKLQWCQEKVEYLGFVLTQGKHRISPQRIQSVVGLVTPQTKTADNG